MCNYDELLKTALSARENNTDQELLIERYKPYIQREARQNSCWARFYDRNYAVETADFISSGTVGLLRAISKFPPPEVVAKIGWRPDLCNFEIDDFFKNEIREEIQKCRRDGRKDGRKLVSEPLNRPILTSNIEEQFRERALQAIDELPQQDKDIIYRRIINKSKFGDIADPYDKSKEWARKKYYKIRKSLRRRLQLAPNP